MAGMCDARFVEARDEDAERAAAVVQRADVPVRKSAGPEDNVFLCDAVVTGVERRCCRRLLVLSLGLRL